MLEEEEDGKMEMGKAFILETSLCLYLPKSRLVPGERG